MKYFVFLFIIFVFSCSEYKEREPQLHNTVSFDPAFTAHQVEVITQGMNVWNVYTSGRVVFTEVPDHGDIQVISGTEAEAAAVDKMDNATLANADAETIGLSAPEQGLLWLYLTRIPSGDEGLLQVAAHEAGHQIGMVHIPQSQEALMDPFLNVDLTGDTYLTNYDILQFCNYWGCKGENPAEPLNN